MDAFDAFLLCAKSFCVARIGDHSATLEINGYLTIVTREDVNRRRDAFVERYAKAAKQKDKWPRDVADFLALYFTQERPSLNQPATNQPPAGSR